MCRSLWDLQIALSELGVQVRARARAGLRLAVKHSAARAAGACSRWHWREPDPASCLPARPRCRVYLSLTAAACGAACSALPCAPTACKRCGLSAGVDAQLRLLRWLAPCLPTAVEAPTAGLTQPCNCSLWLPRRAPLCCPTPQAALFEGSAAAAKAPGKPMPPALAVHGPEEEVSPDKVISLGRWLPGEEEGGAAGEEEQGQSATSPWRIGSAPAAVGAAPAAGSPEAAGQPPAVPRLSLSPLEASPGTTASPSAGGGASPGQHRLTPGRLQALATPNPAFSPAPSPGRPGSRAAGAEPLRLKLSPPSDSERGSPGAADDFVNVLVSPEKPEHVRLMSGEPSCCAMLGRHGRCVRVGGGMGRGRSAIPQNSRTLCNRCSTAAAACFLFNLAIACPLPRSPVEHHSPAACRQRGGLAAPHRAAAAAGIV